MTGEHHFADDSVKRERQAVRRWRDRLSGQNSRKDLTASVRRVEKPDIEGVRLMLTRPRGGFLFGHYAAELMRRS